MLLNRLISADAAGVVLVMSSGEFPAAVGGRPLVDPLVVDCIVVVREQRQLAVLGESGSCAVLVRVKHMHAP